MEKFFRKLQNYFCTFNFSSFTLLFRKCVNYAPKLTKKKNSRNVTSPSYFLILFSFFLFLSLSNKSFQTLEKNLKKSNKAPFSKAPPPLQKKISSPFQNANPQRFQRPLIPSSRSHV